MEQTLHQQRVRTTAVNTHPTAPRLLEQQSEPIDVSRWERIKMFFKNPLVLVGLTWVVMALLLAREIFAR